MSKTAGGEKGEKRMNVAGVERIKAFARIFTEMASAFKDELPPNFDDDLLVDIVVRRLQKQVHPDTVRQAIHCVNSAHETTGT